MHPMLNTAVKAARRAGALINRATLDLDLVKVNQKGPFDLVTEIDIAAEEAIIDTLRTAYPQHAMLAEESGTTLPSANTADDPPTWIIDPIDGTVNFIHGMPQFAISIALRQGKQIMHAVVYDPTRDELFTASRGKGAFLNDRRIRVARRTRLHEALVGSNLPQRSPSATPAWFDTLQQRAAGVRRLGSSVLDLAYVAAGRLDAYCGIGLKPWDIAAGSLLITEAGGLVGDETGEGDFLERGNVFCANAKLYSLLFNDIQVNAGVR